METIRKLAAQASVDTGVEIIRIERTADFPVRPSREVPDIRRWRILYAHGELGASDPQPITKPGAFTIYVRGTLEAARAIERWFRARGMIALGTHVGSVGVQLG